MLSTLIGDHHWQSENDDDKSDFEIDPQAAVNRDANADDMFATWDKEALDEQPPGVMAAETEFKASTQWQAIDKQGLVQCGALVARSKFNGDYYLTSAWIKDAEKTGEGTGARSRNAQVSAAFSKFNEMLAKIEAFVDDLNKQREARIVTRVERRDARRAARRDARRAVRRAARAAAAKQPKKH